MSSDQSRIFENNYKCWKVFGIWGGRDPPKYYKYFSLFYLFITFFVYNILLTLNLVYTPRKIEFILPEIIFYFTEISVASKVFTIMLLRSKIIEALNIIDGDDFLGDYHIKDGILYKMHSDYKLGWRLYTASSHITFSSSVLVPIFINMIRGTETNLPICKYYFLSDETRQSYFIFWFLYQSVGMYGHMMYNVNIDSFIAGLLYIAITQLRILKNKLSSLKLSEEESKQTKDLQDKVSIARLNSCLRHYDTILEYYETIQDILSATIFAQFGVASVIICVVMCGLLLPSSTESRIFLCLYLFNMAMQIFVPGLLGTQLTYESQEIIFAAYDSEWIPRSRPFKKSLVILMHRALKPITIKGLHMFTLSLVTFTSIMKTAYSFFTLVRFFQEE